MVLRREFGQFSVQNCPQIPSTTTRSIYIAYGSVEIIDNVQRTIVIYFERYN